MEYDFETNKVIKKIKDSKAKKVLLQFPEGLKINAVKIAGEIEKATGAVIMIWAGSCFGACDIPAVKCDLMVQYGHSKFVK
ncbi:MAG: diphthamide synthesis protein [Candidatus Nanoarchaeia archaeon]|nr:diphthamide synthesis protein [Candidatus Nanoarchaeia archaeon]